MPEVMEVYRMAGEVDYMLHVAVADMAAFDRFYKRLIAAVPLRNVTSRFAMERIKHTTAFHLPRSAFRDRGQPGDRVEHHVFQYGAKLNGFPDHWLVFGRQVDALGHDHQHLPQGEDDERACVIKYGNEAGRRGEAPEPAFHQQHQHRKCRGEDRLARSEDGSHAASP